MSDASLMNRTTSSKKRGSVAAQPHAQQAALLTLGIAPVIFSSDRVRIGWLEPEEHGLIKDLRREHGRTHAFRFDARDGKITNIGLRPGIEPMGNIDEVAVGEHLLLLAEAIEHQIRHWLSGSRKILLPVRPNLEVNPRLR